MRLKKREKTVAREREKRKPSRRPSEERYSLDVKKENKAKGERKQQ